MRLVVSPLETFCRQVSINLGCDQMRVPEQFLNAAQIRSRIEQVGRVTVAQLVRCQVRIETGDGKVFFQPQLQVPR